MGEVVTLYPSNHRDIPATLRAIAAEIEAGDYGDVQTVALALYGNNLEVFGAGPDATGADIALALGAAHLRLLRAVEEHNL